jgi:hypothetical protein
MLIGAVCCLGFQDGDLYNLSNSQRQKMVNAGYRHMSCYRIEPFQDQFDTTRIYSVEVDSNGQIKRQEAVPRSRDSYHSYRMDSARKIKTRHIEDGPVRHVTKKMYKRRKIYKETRTTFDRNDRRIMRMDFKNGELYYKTLWSYDSHGLLIKKARFGYMVPQGDTVVFDRLVKPVVYLFEYE